MTAQLWSAVSAQAEAWRQTPVVQRFAAQLPQTGTPGNKGLPRLLQNIDAGVSILVHPLRMASSLPFAGQFHQAELARIHADHTQWVEDAARVEMAHRHTVAWLRARLPGYPMLPAPQLASGTAVTTNEFTHNLIWAREDFAAGLQFVDPLPTVADALQASSGFRPQLEQAARDVSAALTGTAEWQDFLAATHGLDEKGRQALREARQHITSALAPAAVDAHEPNLAAPRNDYRLSVVKEQIQGLDGPAHTYADAFGRVDGLITLAASDVFGQLVCFDVIDVQTDELERHLDDPTIVTFQCSDQRWFKPGVLMSVNDPSVPDLVMATSVGNNWMNTGEQTITVSGRVLPGSKSLKPAAG